MSSNLAATYAKLWILLSTRFKWAAAALLAGTIVGSALEVLGIALLGLLLAELGSRQGGAAGTGGPPLFSLLQSWSPGSGVAQSLLLGCGAVFLFKNAFMALHGWVEATIAFKLQADVSARLIDDSLRLEYERAVARPPSEYVALLSADLGSLVFHTLLPALTLLSEIVLVAALFLYLAGSQTSVTFTVTAALLLLGGLLVGSSRKIVIGLSKRRQVLEDSRYRQLQHTFASLRDVYIYHAGTRLQQLLRQDTSELAGVYRGYQMMATGPRFVLEAVMVAILLGIIAVGLHTQDREVLIASVGVFAASGFRLLIGANRMIMSVQSLRFGSAALDRVWRAIGPDTGTERVGPAEEAKEGQWQHLRACGAAYRYAADAPLIGPLSLQVGRGEMIGIMGPSGSGKSTLLEILAGLRRTQAGSVELLDGQGQVDTILGPSPRVVLVGQGTAVLAASVRENITFGLAPGAIPDATLWDVLRLVHLDKFVRSLPQQLDTGIAEYGASLSGGQVQRIGLARAMCRNSSFLLLDEPTSALDAATEAELVRALRQLTGRCGIVLVSHRTAPLQHCDRVYELGRTGLRLLAPTAAA